MGSPLFKRFLVFLDILENHPDDRTVRRLRKSQDPQKTPPHWKRPIHDSLHQAYQQALKGQIQDMEISLMDYFQHTEETCIELAGNHLCNKRFISQQLSAC